MSNSASPLVIAVAGHSGAGKTTLIKGAASSLSASTCFFDDFQPLLRRFASIHSWCAAGADVNCWETVGMRTAILHLRSLHTDDCEKRLILVEEPFGRLRKSLSDIIDVSAFLDVPLDVALARKIGRITSIQTDAAARLQRVHATVDRYLRESRELYLMTEEIVKPTSNVVLDGSTGPNEVRACFENWIGEFIRRSHDLGRQGARIQL